MVERTRKGGMKTIMVKAQPKLEEEEKVIRFTVKPRLNVEWEEGTVDNEFMNKRKSKSKYY